MNSQTQNSQEDIQIEYIDQVQSVIEIPFNFREYYQQEIEDNQNQNLSSQPLTVSHKLKIICLLGITGQGKSYTANTLCGIPEEFQTSSKTKSCTQDTTGKYFYWQEQNLSKCNKFTEEQKKTPFLVIDTPGLNDSGGRDTTNIAKMVSFLKNIHYVHTFMICFNSEDPRLHENKLSILKLFSSMFGDDFYNNIVLCFTRWSHDQKSKQYRQISGRNEQSVILQIQQQFQAKLGVTINNDQCIFIDNKYQEDEEEYSPQELEENAQQLQILFQKTLNNNAFTCKDLKAALKDNDKLRQQYEAIEKESRENQLKLQEVQQLNEQQKSQIERLKQEQQQKQQQFQKQQEEVQAVLQRKKEKQQKKEQQRQQQIQQDRIRFEQQQQMQIQQFEDQLEQQAKQNEYQLQNLGSELEREISIKENLKDTIQKQKKQCKQLQQLVSQQNQQLQQVLLGDKQGQNNESQN